MANGVVDVKLMDLVSGKLIEASIEPMAAKDFTLIKKSKERFDKFEWNKFKQKEVFKLKLKENDLIVGLMCLIEHHDPGIDAIEIELLEVSTENIGQEKTLDHIGGCLIAYACRESFKRGHEGFVFLVPKTSLIDHYANKYGFHYEPVKLPNRPNGFMVHNETGARKLIKEYLDRS
jgi:hypothetical protein